MKDAFYFSHDSNASRDAKIVAVRRKFGAMGYGVYFMIIERLREERDYTHCRCYADLAYDIQVDEEVVRSIVEDFELFAFTECGDRFFSPSLLRRMELMEASLQERSKSSASKSRRTGISRGNPNFLLGHTNPYKEKIEKNRENSDKINNSDNSVDNSLTIIPNYDNDAAIAKDNSVQNYERIMPPIKEKKEKETEPNLTQGGESAPETRNATPRFVAPTEGEVERFVREGGYEVDAERFVSFYASKGWMVGRNKMKDWQAAVRNWHRRERKEVAERKPVGECRVLEWGQRSEAVGMRFNRDANAEWGRAV